MVTEAEPAMRRQLSSRPVGRKALLASAWWGLGSFAVRMIAWWWAMRASIQPSFDEGYYWDRAQGFADLVARRGPPSDAWQAAYGHGVWPPLHPFLLGLASLVGPDPLESARLFGVFLSALTTVFIWCLANRLAGRRAASVAAGIHTLYPPLIAFSHLLFSETLFIALLVGATLAFVKAVESRRGRWAILCGVLCGLMLLTRASAAPFLIVFLLAALLIPSSIQAKIRTAAMLFIPALVFGVCWLVVLDREEGRFVYFSTTNGYNFYLGNNPYIRPGHGSAWGDYSVLPILQQQMIAETGVPHMAYWDKPASRRAWAYVRQEPGKAVERGGLRFFETWTPDSFVPKYFARRIYPPEPWAGVAVLLGTLGHFLILAFGLPGLFLVRRRGLLVSLILAGMVGPVLTIASSRFGLPMLVLLIVPAGCAFDIALKALLMRKRTVPA